MTERKPSLIRIFSIDYWTLFPTLFSFFFTAFVAYDLVIKKEIFSNFYLTLIVISIIAFVFALGRIIFIYSLFGYGQEETATISSVAFFRDRGRIQFVYPFEGDNYLRKYRVMKTKLTKQLKNGDQVTVLINPNKPKQAIILDLLQADKK